MHRPSALHWLAPLALAGSLAALGAEPAVPSPKTHTLFMGANLSIVTKDSTLPVSDVKNNAFVVDGPHGRIVVPAESKEHRIRIDDTLKLTTEYVRIDQLKFERTYTPGNDPMTKFADTARTGSYIDSNRDAADAALRNAQTGSGLANATVEGLRAVGADSRGMGSALAMQAQTAATLAGAEAAYTNAQTSTNMEIFSTVSMSSRLTSDIAAEQFDALAVTFDIAAPRPMDKPYLVVFMRFLAAKDQPETASVLVYAEKLPVLDEHPRSIRMFRGGFPPGYHIDSYHVHLYDGTTEVATSVSRKQVALTTDEAFQYQVVEYLVRNRDQTKPPAKARGFWPTDLHSRLIPDKLTRSIFVKVGKDGKALGIFEDENCARPIADGELAVLAPELHFWPALAKGKPVEGVVSITLGRPTG